MTVRGIGLMGHQRRFEGTPATSALSPISGVLLSRSKQCSGHHSHAVRRDEAPWLGFKVTLDRPR